MRDREKDAAEKAVRKQRAMETGFRMFSEKGIEQVTMPDIARESGIGRASLYRYFSTKVDLVIAIGTWKWRECLRELDQRAGPEELAAMSAGERLEYYLDSFLYLYRNHPDVLRFNHFFNSYVRDEKATPEQMRSYMQLTEEMVVRIHAVCRRAKEDGTLRTDISEMTVVSSTLHMMLAVVTRYAAGLVYVSEDVRPEEELLLLRNALMREFTGKA